MHGRVWAPILLAALGCTELDESTAAAPVTPGPACPAGEGECSPPPCSASAPDGVCDPGEICRAGSCEPLCAPEQPSGWCPEETFCSTAGLCVSDGTCLTDGDCSDEHHCVSGGICLPVGACLVDADCGDFARCAAEGLCIELGTCIDARDCEEIERCGVLGHCLAPGTCEASLDCPPGRICAAGACEASSASCSTNETTDVGCNEYELFCCPSGETCCPGRERCSTDGSCIYHEHCSSDDDCLSGYACVDFACVADVPCGGSCGEGERCSWVGGCIADDLCAHDMDCPGDSICTSTFECQVHPEAACGGCYGTVARTVDAFPNVLLAVDRSSATNGCGSESTWWSAVRDGVGEIAARYGDRVHLGLSSFPVCADAGCEEPCAPETCSCSAGDTAAGQLEVPIALGNGVAIDEHFTLASPGGERAMGATLRAIAAAPGSYGLTDPVRDNAVILITSGVAGSDDVEVEGCESADASCKVDRAIAALAALDPPVRTYVVAVGIDGLEPDLSCHAAHGGTCGEVAVADCAEEPCHQSAADAGAVALAVENALRELVPCTFPVPQAAVGVRVYLDDRVELSEVSMDEENGWAFDSAETIRLRGAACDRVRSGQAAPVLIGCHLCE